MSPCPRPALQPHLSASQPAEETEDDESEEGDNEERDDNVQRRRGIHWNLMIQNLVRTDHTRSLNVILVHQLQCHSNV